MREVIFDVPGISCDHCARAITGALEPLDGVRRVHVDVPGRTVTVALADGSVGVDRLTAALAEEEYPVSAVR
jgi:copper chaperone